MIELDDESDGLGQAHLTPMLDCIFLLLIFFLVAATFRSVERVIPLELPVATTAEPGQNPLRPIVIAVDAAGSVFLDGQPTPLENVGERAKSLRGENESLPIRIDADRSAAYESVLNVIDKLRAADITNVSLKTLDTP